VSRTHSAAASAAASFFLFAAVDATALFTFAVLARVAGFPWQQWIWLASVSIATVVTCFILEPQGWQIGLTGPPRRALLELLYGLALGTCVIGACDLALYASGHVRHAFCGAFPWTELASVFLPAAFHEELAFRGYVFQRFREWNRGVAFAFSALVFALMHFRNHGLTLLALGNIALAGILLALAYERFERLWFPIGIHLVWNVLSGPILGYPVSGFVARSTVFTTTALGNEWMTGGVFGIEGSVLITIAEIAAIAVLGYHPGRKDEGGRMKDEERRR